MGPSAAMPSVRPRRLLRRLAEPACDEALPQDVASGDPVLRAGRDVAVLLRGRPLRRVLKDRVDDPVSDRLRSIERAAAMEVVLDLLDMPAAVGGERSRETERELVQLLRPRLDVTERP